MTAVRDGAKEPTRVIGLGQRHRRDRLDRDGLDCDGLDCDAPGVGEGAAVVAQVHQALATQVS